MAYGSVLWKIVRGLLLDEITEVLCGNLNNLGEIEWHLHYLETLAKQEVLNIVIPNSAVRMKAIENYKNR